MVIRSRHSRAPQAQSGSRSMWRADCKTLHPPSGVTGLSSQVAGSVVKNLPANAGDTGDPGPIPR